jgi:hypothetical protein
VDMNYTHEHTYDVPWDMVLGPILEKHCLQTGNSIEKVRFICEGHRVMGHITAESVSSKIAFESTTVC